MRPLLVLLCAAMTAFGFGAQAEAKGPVTAAAFAADGKHVVLGSQSRIEVRSWPEFAVMRTLQVELPQIHDLKFSPDGGSLLVAGGAPAEEGAVEVLRWPSGERIYRAALHADVVYRVAWSPDGSRWATAGGDSLCLVCDAKTGDRRAQYRGHSRPVLSLGYLPDGGAIVSAGLDATVRLWNSETGEHVRTLDNHLGPVNDLAIRRAGSTVIVATVSDDRTIRLWQPEIGRLLRFARLPSPPRAVAWSLAGDRLLVGCNDGQVRTLGVDDLAISSERDGLVGRIHDLAIGPGAGPLVAGQTGCRALAERP
jgi:WD40 repeat protein